MRTTRTLLFLLTLLPVLSWGQGGVTLLPYSSASKSPTTTGTTYLYREDSTGLLVQKSKLGPVERVGVDMNNVRGLTDRLSSERLYQQGQFNTFRTTSNGLYRGMNQPFLRSQIPGLDTALANRATNARVDQIVGSGGDASTTAYPKSISDDRYPLRTTTQSALDIRTMRASRAQVRSDASSSPAPYFYITDSGREGTFYLDALDTSTPDDGAMVLVTAGGKRLKRVVSGGKFLATWWGLVGDGQADDTQALRDAIAFACKANNPASFGAFSPSRNSNTLDIPHGVITATDEIPVPGSLHIRMEEVTSYGGTRIIQKTAGKHLFHIRADTDGHSSAVKFSGGILRQGSATSAADVALIYCGETASDGNNNSTYIERVWFQTPENYAINFKRGDDIRIVDCTFDVAPFNAIKLGSAGNPVTQFQITGNTFYHVALNAIELANVVGGIIAHNKVYTSDGDNLGTNFVNAQNAAKCEAINITGNELRNVPYGVVLSTVAQGITIASNTVTRGSQLLTVTGGGILYALTLTGNTFTRPTAPTMPAVDMTGCGLQGSTLGNNIFVASAAGNFPAFSMSDSRITGNAFTGNTQLGYSVLHNMANPVSNGVQDFTKFVQGSSVTRATRITALNASLPSSFYTYAGTANVPTDASGFNEWQPTINAYEVNGAQQGWSSITLSNLKTKLFYTGGFDGQTGALVPWTLQLGTQDTPTTGDLFYWDGSTLRRIPKGTNGQFLKMVSGLPAWSN